MATPKRNLIIGKDGLSIGARVRKLREERGVSVAGLANAAKIDAGTLKKLENDGSNAPSFPNGLRLAWALGVSPWELAGELEPTEESSIMHQAIAAAEMSAAFLRGGNRLEREPTPQEIEDARRADRVLEKVRDRILQEIRADREAGAQQSQDEPVALDA